MQQGKVNYFIGNDPKKWRTNIPTYTSVRYKEIYKGIDIKFYGNNNQMEYDIIVKPGGDPNNVQLAYEGIEGIKVTQEGNLEIALKEGKIIQKKPVIYQEINGERVAVDGKFKIQTLSILEGEGRGEGEFSYTFQLASYNKSHDLIIDPVIVWSTYLGGSGGSWCGGCEEGLDIAVDASGNAYITGRTDSTDFPTAFPVQGAFMGGGSDVFVTKINTSGSGLIYSTYLGGSGFDYGNGIAVDISGNAYITGTTTSTDFPIISPIQNINAGSADIFVTKVDISGSKIIYSTYLGGSGGTGFETGLDIAVDISGNAYITGRTDSADFPTVVPIYGVFGGGWYDAFVAKIDTTGSNLVYSTYLRGKDYDEGTSIAVDTSGNAYITGLSGSTDFPISSAIQGMIAGGYDAFVTKIDTSGSNIIYSTYLGGSKLDGGSSITVDNAGNAYVTGYTGGGFYLVSPLQETYLGGWYDAFVTKINAEGSRLVYSTYLGGSNMDISHSIAVDTSGNAYITGYTDSSDFPMVSPIHGTYRGGYSDAFIAKIDALGSSLIYSTYLGGSGGWDWGNAIAVDSSKNVYITGRTDSTDFPVVSPLQGTNAGGGWVSTDAFVAKIAAEAVPSTPAEVVNAVDAMLASGEISSTAIANSIVSQLSNAQENFTTNPASAANMLNAVINFIEAQSGKKITNESAETLIRYLTDIINGF